MLASRGARSGRGLNILCLDGGGIRGLCMLEALKKLERATGRQVHELFDIICGTSTGGLMTMLLGVKRLSLDEVSAAYEKVRKRMADHTTISGSVARLTGGCLYDDKMIDGLLQEILGEDRLDEVPSIPKCFVVAAACNSTPAQPYLFRNYQLTREASAATQLLGTNHCQMWEAVRSTTAAPTFYNPAVVGTQRFVDGGILANNPSLIALTEAAVLWPEATVSCVVSLGCGMPSSRKHTASSALEWAGYLINEISMSSHVTHAIASSLLGEGQYFRIDPPKVDVPISETRLPVIEKMVQSAKAFLETDHMEALVRRVGRVLTSTRPSGREVLLPVVHKRPAAPTPRVVQAHPLLAEVEQREEDETA